jgi:hypothetical protein
MQHVSITSIYFCLLDEDTKEAMKLTRFHIRGMPTMKPQRKKRLRTKHEPTNETTSRVKGRKMQNNTFDQIASANTVSMDAGLSQFAFAKASSTLFKKVFSK